MPQPYRRGPGIGTVFIIMMACVVFTGLISYTSGMHAQAKTDRSTGVCK